MHRNSSSLKEQEILTRLRTHRLGRPLLILNTCASTNNIAAESARNGAPHGFTVISEEQTSGRGRFGRPWLSPKGGVWMTVLLREPQESLTGLPLIGALAIAEAIDSTLDIKARVRWPNDVVVDNRKLAGVIVEAKSRGTQLEYALLGLGINTNFPARLLTDITDATTLLDLLGSPVDNEKLICSILTNAEELIERLSSDGPQTISDMLERSECSIGRRVKVRLQDAEVIGVFAGYDGLTGVRILSSDGGTRRVETASVISAGYVYG